MTYYAVERPENGGFVELMVGIARPKPARTGDLAWACALAQGCLGARIVRVDPGNRRTILGKDAVGRWVDPKARQAPASALPGREAPLFLSQPRSATRKPWRLRTGPSPPNGGDAWHPSTSEGSPRLRSARVRRRDAGRPAVTKRMASAWRAGSSSESV